MISKKRYIDFSEAKGLVGNIARHIQKNNYKIVGVVGIVRGGLPPATMLSHYFGVPLYIIDYSLRDRNNAQHFNNHAVEVIRDAYGTVGQDGYILVVDDINDSGDTFKAIWNFIDEELFAPKGFIYAALLEKCTSKFDCDFYGEILMDEQCNDWIVFPWEEWWQK